MDLRPFRPVCGLALFALTSLLGGCATGGSVKNVQSDVGRTQDQLRALSRQVATLDSLLRAQGVESRRAWTEISSDGDDVKRRVRQVQAQMDEAARRLADLAKNLESMRLYSGGRAASYGRPAASAPADTSAQPTSRPSLISDVQGLYDQASEDMNAGQTSLAILEFSQLLEASPQSDLADNALYWLGECYHAQKNLPKAVESFQRVIKDYPNSEIAPSAMLQLGYALLEAKERDKGIRQLNELIKSYPDAKEAGQARERLKKLGPAYRPAAPGKRR